MMYIIAAAVAALIIAADQITKYYVVHNFVMGAGSTPFIKGLINFTYVENEGGAWGIMQDHTWMLIGFTIIMMIICLALLIKNGFKSKLLFMSVTLVLSGGIGNLIDRISRGSVVDFIQFDFWRSFPIFNIADIAVCVGAGLLLLYFVLDMVKDYRAKKSLVDINAETSVADLENEAIEENEKIKSDDN